MTQAPDSIVVSSTHFSGSIEALQDRMARGSIRATDVSLMSITRDYKHRIAGCETIDLEEVGEFISVVSRLISYKAGELVPTPETEPCEIYATSLRIPTGPAVKVATMVSALREREGQETFPGGSRLAEYPRPQEPRPPTVLRRAWLDMQKRLTGDRVHVTTPPFVRLEVAVSRLIRNLKTMSRMTFRSLISGGSRHDAVVHFLAVLELVRRRQIVAEQQGLFAEISLEPRRQVSDTDVRAG